MFFRLTGARGSRMPAVPICEPASFVFCFYRNERHISPGVNPKVLLADAAPRRFRRVEAPRARAVWVYFRQRSTGVAGGGRLDNDSVWSSRPKHTKLVVADWVFSGDRAPP